MGVLNLPPEEMPTAVHIAVAVVAAAKVLDEDPLNLGSPGTLCRARWPAMAALMIFYPLVPPARLGAYLGAEKSQTSRLRQAEEKPWWAELGVAAMTAACDALEAA